jgi:hypothetical protein
MPPQMAIAMPRRSAGNASLINVSVSGITIAAPTPWIAGWQNEHAHGRSEGRTG